MKLLRLAVLLAATSGVAGCETISETLEGMRKIDYGKTETAPPLTVPPDLTSSARAGTVPGSEPTTYSQYSDGKQDEVAPKTVAVAAVSTGSAPASAVSSAGVLPSVAGVEMQREGAARWLVVSAAPEALWPHVRGFVVDNGLPIDFENPVTGIIDTAWLDNRATVAGKPTGFAKLLSPPAVAGTRDKLRFALERGKQPGTTNVLLTSRGMDNVGSAAAPKWNTRAADAGLEQEVLQLLAAHLGSQRGLVASSTVTPVATKAGPAPGGSRPMDTAVPLEKCGDDVCIVLNTSREVAWKNVGIAIELAGIPIDERDEKGQKYHVRITDNTVQKTERTWLRAVLMGEFPDTDEQTKEEARSPEELYTKRDDGYRARTKKSKAAGFQVFVVPSGSVTNVFVRDAGGAPLEQPRKGEHILNLIYHQLQQIR